MTCTFFGHKQIHNSDEVCAKLYDTLTDLIKNRGIRKFLVGNNGAFDRTVLKVLRKISETYDIDYTVVRSYINKKDEYDDVRPHESVYPEVLEKTPLRFAIDKRNRFMINRSEIVLTYIENPFGGAAKYAEICEKCNMEIIRLGKF